MSGGNSIHEHITRRRGHLTVIICNYVVNIVMDIMNTINGVHYYIYSRLHCVRHFTLRDRKKIVFRCAETPPSILNQSAPNVEEHITVTQGVT